jgi:hypothetical protein
MRKAQAFVTIAALFALGIGLAVASRADTASKTVPRLQKKLIEYGWDTPTVEFVRDNIRNMEKYPFDGLLFYCAGGRNVLEPNAWDERTFEKDFAAAKAIRWRRFTDNFMTILAASDQDWFNDQHWKNIEHNIRLVARAARLARCVGICFDHEPYGTNPWHYPSMPHKDTKTFAQYEDKVRERAAQFTRALMQEFPKPKMLTFFQFSLFPELCRPMDPKDRAAALSENGYGLLPAFINGMLEAGGTDLTIIDGNESAYYYTDRNQYLDEYHLVTQRALLLLDPLLWPLYRTQMRVGQALYIDQYFGLRENTKTYGNYMTPEERAKWFEHNVYWALYTSDEYVWCYSERMNWWSSTPVIPPGCEEAIRSARRKLTAGEGLGFDLAPIIERAQERERAELAARIKTRTAQIQRLPAQVPPPQIDGALDDAAWKAVTPLDPFLLLAASPEKEFAATQAWVTYDDNALYIAFRCQEPQPDGMTLVGKRRDDPVWHGDDVEFMIAPPRATTPFFHFMINPEGAFWDSTNSGKTDDTGYNPDWQHAAAIGPDFWAAEAAVPWAAMKMTPPAPGTRLRADLCRQRMQGDELSCWSSMVRGFLEADLFGTWEF